MGFLKELYQVYSINPQRGESSSGIERVLRSALRVEVTHQLEKSPAERALDYYFPTDRVLKLKDRADEMWDQTKSRRSVKAK